jgi:PAS domain S-box-containing protein
MEPVERRVALALSLVGVVVLTPLWITYRAGHSTVEATAWVSHTHAVLGELEGILADTTQARLNMDRFVASGEQSDLGPYRAIREQIRRRLSILGQMTADNPRQQERLIPLEQAIAERSSSLEAAISVRSNAGPEATLQSLRSDTARRAMQAVRKTVAEMAAEENALLRLRQSKSEASQREASVAFVSLMAAVFVLLGFVWYILDRDVRSRRSAHEELRRSADELRDLYDNAPCGYYSLDSDGVFLRINATLLAWLGYRQEEVFQKMKFRDMLTPKSAERFETAFERFKEDGRIDELGLDMVRKDGTVVPMVLAAGAVRDPSGRYVSSRGTVFDISERKRAEAVREQLAAIVDYSDDAIVRKTLEGVIVSWNKGAERLYGYSAEEVIGKSIYTLMPADYADELAAILKTVREGLVVHAETVRRRKDGRLIDVLITVSAIQDAEGCMTGAAILGRDITARKRAEQEIRKLNESLASANDELDQRVQARTHDLACAVEQLQSEIAGHRRTEAALRESEERIAFGLEAAGMGRWDLDLVTGRSKRSLRHDQVFGYEALLPEWTYGMLLDHILPQDRSHVAELFEAAIRGGSVCEFECRIKPPDQSLRWIWGRGKIRRDETGKAVSMLGIIGDITDRKLAEHRLRTQIERLSLLDQITCAIAERQDLQSIYQVVIRSLEESFPIDFGCVCLHDPAAKTLTVTCVGVGSEALAMDLALTRQAQIAIDQNGLSRCVGGQLVYEQDLTQLKDFPFPQRLAGSGLRAMVAAPLVVESQVFAVLIAARREPRSFSSGDCEFLRQLTGHVALAAHEAKVRAALQQAYDELRQTQQTVMQQERLRALGQMASGIAHDINNALSPIALYTESLLEREPNLSKRTHEYLETTQRAIEDVAHTVGRLSEFSRQREPQLMLLAVDVNRLVEQVMALTRARWSDMPQQRGIVIRVRAELTPQLPAVAGIESEIREALINLIFNAVDAMPDGGTLKVRTQAAPSAWDGRARGVCVEFEDTGIGMDEPTRRRCLEPFFTTKGDRGTGLGLAMVYGVAQRMNAEIEIESTVGKGTMIRMSFPPQVAAAKAVPLAYVTGAPLHLRILVVDDDPLISKSLRDALEAEGHAVTTANGGQEGIDTWREAEERKKPFAIVITDLGMPNIDGRKVAIAVKAVRPAAPVILLTGWGQRMAAEQDKPACVDRVLNKPPKLNELRAAFIELVTESNGNQIPAELEYVS